MTNDDEEPLLELRDVVAGYGASRILHGVSAKIFERELVTIIGPNGAGKSTLLKSVFGIARVFSGEIWYNGKKINGFKPHELVRRGIAYVPQLENVFPSLTVEENLKMGAFIRNDKRIENDIKSIYYMFVDLYEKRKEKANNLSGGQRQMLALARGLMTNPKLILLDEPSAGLSPLARDEVLKKVKEIKSKGIGIVLVEQNVRKSLEIADRCYILAMGRNIFDGTADEVLQNEDIGKMFLGKR
jgi:ABC-type branched-subunit amino acid transport system ATPase component